MGKIYSFLGLSVAVLQEGHNQLQKREAFNADITYLTAHQLGFTFLADTSSADNKAKLVGLINQCLFLEVKGSTGADGIWLLDMPV